jgi:hypothetical protein
MRIESTELVVGGEEREDEGGERKKRKGDRVWGREGRQEQTEGSSWGAWSPRRRQPPGLVAREEGKEV